ncbi:MAG: hypothetical protein KGR26_13635, partial [Cyanobacteria bacterium REEB65]|nr:hypothetical protein [Cyanobacteria bacterium REEB65]
FITGDNDLSSDAFSEALTDVLALTALQCNRTWLYGQYTEMLYLSKNGMVYPSATPLDPNQQVISGSEVFNPPSNTEGQSASVIQGNGIWVGWFTPLPWMPVWTGVIPPQTQVTYWGGFTQSTVPPNLQRLWAKVIYYMTHPVALQGLPGGVKSMGIGGVSVGGDLSSFMIADPDLRRLVRRFTRPQPRAWQS